MHTGPFIRLVGWGVIHVVLVNENKSWVDSLFTLTACSKLRLSGDTEVKEK